MNNVELMRAAVAYEEKVDAEVLAALGTVGEAGSWGVCVAASKRRASEAPGLPEGGVLAALGRLVEAGLVVEVERRHAERRWVQTSEGARVAADRRVGA